MTSVAQFERVSVDLSSAEDWRGAMDLIEAGLGGARTATRSPHLVARLLLTGRTPLAFKLRRGRDMLLAEIEQRAEGLGQTWIEKIELGTDAPAAPLSVQTADPVSELGVLMQRDIISAAATRHDIRQMVEDLRNELPAEIRGFAGDDAAELDAFVDRLLADGSQDILARLRADSAGQD